LKGKRDGTILGLLLGCGLRCDELVRLTLEEIQQRESRWVIVDILGKGRTPRDDSFAELGKTWIAAAGVTEGCVFRAINKGGLRLQRRTHGEYRLVHRAALCGRDRRAKTFAP
jgi:site-specific recombinase XerC